MKNLYLGLLISFIFFSFNTSVIAQCDNVTVESITNPGPYGVAILTELDGIRNGPDYDGATIYYPTNATPPFASIAIVPGFVSLPSSVQEWGPFYASHGIVTIIIGTNSLFDDPETRANALLDALETIKQENVRNSSPIEGLLDLSQLAVSGWSMGGGGAQRAAVLDNSIAGVVALCPYLENPVLNHDVPVLIFSGQNDAVATPSQQADVHYNVTPSTTNKVLYEIKGGNHSAANTPNGGGGSVGKIALSWLKLYVENDKCYCSLLTDDLLLNPSEASKVEQSFDCDLLAINEQELKIGYYPNPTKNTVNLEISKDVYYELISPLGQRMFGGYLTGNNKQIDLSELPTNIYYLHIEGQVVKLVKLD
ncbi:T9SS type A sorting domain-containing protein [Brumimicrobium glaciale]|uniref:T9SS type A sorting domain-containing protein n=1 Tax=Brumimicrobium glaciale TaxID=200475 RepID=A0A4Q4KLS4_9FLAO|nr:alpha/beta hydrolase [Brumimicrobium glaciale]RYM32789.1 T9SS type A sorting domain-containing protein [Brumimicrobium glaciale]